MENVKAYPRPPRIEPSTRRVRIEFGGTEIVDTKDAVRVLEKTHPPSYYIPRYEIRAEYLRPAEGTTYCEWKGVATYFDIVVGGKVAHKAAWTYEEPKEGFESIAGFLSFYPGRVDKCWLDEEQVSNERGRYYGGWVTDDIVGLS